MQHDIHIRHKRWIHMQHKTTLLAEQEAKTDWLTRAYNSRCNEAPETKPPSFMP